MLQAAGRGLAFAVLALSVGSALAITQSGEQKDMRLVGHSNLQFRGAYQPSVIVYPDGRTIAFAGTHGGSKLNTLLNRLDPKSDPVEPNGTMIIDATNPAAPVEKFHIPVPVAGGQAQMLRPGDPAAPSDRGPKLVAA